MSLHDIPLAVEEQGDTAGNNNDRISKTNSLRRFFKLPNKKSLEAAIAMEKDGNKDVDVEAGESKGKDQQKRFHLRVGNSTQHTNVESGGFSRETATATLSQASTSTASRPTLRGSISNYWNTVFKRNNVKRGSSPSAATVGHDGEDGGNSSDEDLGNSDAKRADDAVHTLPISEDGVAPVAATPSSAPVPTATSTTTTSATAGSPKPITRPSTTRTTSPPAGAKGKK